VRVAAAGTLLRRRENEFRQGETMNAENLTNVSDAELVARLAALVRERRRLTVAVLLHLAEVDARGLHRQAACPSLHVYCTRVLGMSEDQALKRIRAARALRRYPVVAAAVTDGRLHLTAVVLLAPHLTDESADELVAEASGKSKADIKVLLARRAPRPDISERLERAAGHALLVPDRGPAGGEVALEPPPNVANKLAPRSPERFVLQLTIGEATRDKLLRVQALLGHEVPSGDLAEVVDRALDAILDDLEGRRFGKVTRPRAAKTRRVTRQVPSQGRRQVVARGGTRCSFVSADGRPCEETGFLELDQVVPMALGGEAKNGVRTVCRSHNHEAERIVRRAAALAGEAAKAMDDELIAGLRRMGVSASDARRVVAASRGPGAALERVRAALVAIGSVYVALGTIDARRAGGARCKELARDPARTARSRPSRSPP
jgi:hypothetical protein